MGNHRFLVEPEVGGGLLGVGAEKLLPHNRLGPTTFMAKCM